MLNNLAVSYYTLAAGVDLGFFTNLKANAMLLFSSIALVVAGYNVVKSFAKKAWAELVAYLIPAAIALYLLGGIDKLKDLGNWFMSFGN